MRWESSMSDESLSRERSDFLDSLAAQRRFLRYTVRDLNDEQARERTTVSELTLGGIIKHVALVEARWANFIESGAASFSEIDQGSAEEYKLTFRLVETETLQGALDEYERVAQRTDEIVGTVPTFDDDHELPPAPWFKPGTRWSVRTTLLHILAETAQHSGHADIIREALDGAKTMG
jgi:uncharacterized damage-inducible protein DinB